MLYKDIYELLVYLKGNSIQLPLDLKEEILRSSLEPRFFEILKFHPEMIRLFLYPVPTIEKFEFIMSMKSQLPFFKLQKIVNAIDWEDRGNDILKVLNLLDSKYVNDWEIMELIISQATWTCMKQLYLALKSPIIANNKEYFKIIAGQDEWEKMEELRLACKIPVVANNKEYFEIIARQDEWKKMEELRLACENSVVANNKGYFEIIAGQDEWEKMEELRLALENPVIANNKEYFEIIARQDKWEKMEQLNFALKNSIVANSKEYFEIIVGQDEWQKMEQLNFALENPIVANNKEFFEIIARQDTWEKMEELRFACEIPIIANNKEFFEIIATQDSSLKMEQLRLVCETQKKEEEIFNKMQDYCLKWKASSDQKVGKLSSQKELLTKLREVNALIEQEDIESLEVLKMGTLADMEYVPSLIREKKEQSIPKKEVRKNEQ